MCCVCCLPPATPATAPTARLGRLLLQVAAARHPAAMPADFEEADVYIRAAALEVQRGSDGDDGNDAWVDRVLDAALRDARQQLLVAHPDKGGDVEAFYGVDRAVKCLRRAR